MVTWNLNALYFNKQFYYHFASFAWTDINLYEAVKLLMLLTPSQCSMEATSPSGKECEYSKCAESICNCINPPGPHSSEDL